MNRLCSIAFIFYCALAVNSLPGKSADNGESVSRQRAAFEVRAIGVVEKGEDRARIVLDKDYAPGLLGLDGFSHVYVVWWFDRNDTPEARATLQVHPMGNRENPLTGVFATRSPRRPNLIAFSLCKIVSVKENVVELDAIDAFDGTPVLDLKPFIPGYDSEANAQTPGWTGRQ